MIRTSTLMTCLCLVLFSSFIHAATVTSTTTGGDWNSTSTWSDGNLPLNTDDVVISAASTVNITAAGTNAVCKSLTINGVLTFQNNNCLIGLGLGCNNPVIVNGTLSLNGNFSNNFLINGYLKFNMGSTFNMTFGALTINGNNGTGVGSAQAGTAIFDVTDIGTLNATGGTIFILNPHFVNGEPCIKGAKTFGNTVSFGNGNNAITATDYIVSSVKPIFENLELSYTPNNDNKARLSALTIKGKFGVNNGHFYNAGGSEKIFVGSDMIIGTTGIIEGDIEFNGDLQQNINPLSASSPSSVIFNGNLYVNSLKRVKIKLDLEIPLGKRLYFIKGKFDTNNKLFTLSELPVNSSSVNFISTYDLNKEIGSFKLKNVPAGIPTVFPIGYEDGEGFSSYTPLTITPTATSDFTVSAHITNKPTVTTLDTVALHWDISRTGTAAADIVFQWNFTDEKGLFSSRRNNCKVYHFNGSSWDAITSNGANTNGTIHTKSATNVSSFSPFTIFTSPSLPVSLTEFKAKAVGSKAILTWSTASEINNSGFEIEKSLDGNAFQKIDFVKGNGNSNILLSYISIDDNFTQTAFYRLKQVDFDGKIEYSRIVQLEKTKTGTVKVYPNPVTSSTPLSISIESDDNAEANVTLFDVSGRLVFNQKYEANTTLINVPTEQIARGIYFVKIQTGTNVYTQKIVKE
jgi:Secretion system C-terminal sorting domain